MPYKDVNKQKAYSREHYQQNKELYAQKSKIRRNRNREYIWNIKKKSSCTNCGYNAHFAALQFDHIDHTTKDFTISDAISRSMSIERIDEEIAKCQILCGNCHLIKSFNERELKKVVIKEYLNTTVETVI